MNKTRKTLALLLSLVMLLALFAPTALADEAVVTEEETAVPELMTGESMPSVLGVWCFNTVERLPTELHVTTSLDAQYLYLCEYYGGAVLQSWSADSASIVANDYNKEWNVSYVFEFPGPYELCYKVSTDGVTMSDPYYFGTVTITRPPVISWWYDPGFENSPVALHVNTNLDMEYLYIYHGEELIDTWTRNSENVTVVDDEAQLRREWIGTETFPYHGDYHLWYKASADGVNLSNAYSDGPILHVSRPGVIGAWYEDGLWYAGDGENKPVTMHVTTNLDAQYLYMSLGDDLLQTWNADEVDITVYEDSLCKEWTVSYEFEYPGNYNVWFVSSADGENMSLPYSNTEEPAVVRRPQIIELSYGEANVGEPLEISILTNKDVQKVNMYLDEELLASWTRDDAEITEYLSCDTWIVSYTFDEAGEKYLWYKASDDGVTEGNAFPFDPVTIGEGEPGEEVPVDEETFPDASFRAYISVTFDLNEDGVLSKAEIEAVKELNVTGLGIHSLEGIAQFTGIITLDCSENELVDLDLSANTSLKSVICKDNALLTSFALPESMTELTAYAFQNCQGLSTVRLPGTITKIGAYAFNNCTSLTAVELSNAVMVIGQGAFKGCVSLSDMTTY